MGWFSQPSEQERYYAHTRAFHRALAPYRRAYVGRRLSFPKAQGFITGKIVCLEDDRTVVIRWKRSDLSHIMTLPFHQLCDLVSCGTIVLHPHHFWAGLTHE